MKLNPEQQAALFALADAIRAVGYAFGGEAEAVAERMAIQQEQEQEPEQQEPEEITLDSLREMFTSLAKEGKRDGLMAILENRNVKKLPDLPAASYAEVAAEARSL